MINSIDGFRLKSSQVYFRRKVIVLLLLISISVSFPLGCTDPSTMGRFRATPVTNIILDSLGVVDEEPEQFADAREPEPKDLIILEREYVIQAGDVIDISILSLFASNQPWASRMQVSETGRVTIPELGTFRAAGFTELELTENIKNMLSPQIVKDPIVNVVVIGATAKVFSISGAIGGGRFPLSEPDLRIFQALAQAGGIPQSGVDYAYILRTVKAEDIELEQLEQQSDEDFYEGRAEEDLLLPPPPVAPPVAPFIDDQVEQGPIEDQPQPDESLEQEIAPDAVEEDEAPEYDELEAVPETKEPDEELDSVETVPEPEEEPMSPQQERDNLLESISPISGIVCPIEMQVESKVEPADKIETVNYHSSNYDFVSVGEDASLEAADEGQELGFPEVTKSQLTEKPLKIIRKGSKFQLIPAETDIKERVPEDAGVADSDRLPVVQEKLPFDQEDQKVPAQSAKPFKVERKGSSFRLKPTGEPGERYEESAIPDRPMRKLPQEPGESERDRSMSELTGVEYQEVIRVDLKALQNGDLTQNIVIRPGDHIQLPANQTGVYYVTGQVGRPGLYGFVAGERVTLKEAIASAGPLTPLADPERCDITRRIDRDKEVMVRLNLKKLLEGSQSNYFLKPHDIINIGSHPVARWLAVVRNSFRSTSGFGFVYDRNFADKDVFR